MNESNFWKGVAAVALVIAVIGCFTPVGQKAITQVLGGVSNYDTVGASALQVGSGCNDSYKTCLGTKINGINVGQCIIYPYSTTIVASSTAVVDCQAGTIGTLVPLTGVSPGDNVQMTLASTTSSVFGGIVLNGASASSTPGYITLRVSNFTGTTFTWTAAATTSENYISTR